MYRQLFFSFLLTFLSITILAQKAPDFSVVTTDGETINLYEDFLNQGRSVVIELFFVDCPPCRTFAPFMSNLHKKMVSQEVSVEFISLSIVSNDNDETVNEFKKMFEHDWHFAHSGGKSLEAAETYQNGTYGTYFGTPTIAVIAPDGTVNYIRRIFGDNNAYIDNIETAIIDSQTAFNDNMSATAIITGGISTETGTGVNGVVISFSGAVDTTILSDENGNFQTASLLADENYTVSLAKNTNAVNGVTTLDIVLISKHILGIDTFTTNYQRIAADVNRSGGITTFDLVQMRQLILGINDEFPNAPSWLFDPNEIEVSNLGELGDLTFTAIKIGDLNGSANPNDLLVTTERNRPQTMMLSTQDQQFSEGENIQVLISSADLYSIQGYQFSIAFDEKVLTLLDNELRNFNQLFGGHFNLTLKDKGLLSVTWYTDEKVSEQLLFTLPFTTKKAGNLSEILTINSSLTLMEAFDFDNELLGIDLSFQPSQTEILPDISLFPNPSKNKEIFITFKTEKEDRLVVTVVNLAGQVINQSSHWVTPNQHKITLPVLNWPTGLYFLKIENEEKLLGTIRMIKE